MSNSNIQAVTKTADGHAIAGRTRIVGIYYSCSDTASSFALKNGSTSGGTAQVTINTPAVKNSQYLPIADMGVLFEDGVFIDVADANVLSVTLFFYGGAAQ
jgi:hypothetical protein